MTQKMGSFRRLLFPRPHSVLVLTELQLEFKIYWGGRTSMPRTFCRPARHEPLSGHSLLSSKSYRKVGANLKLRLLSYEPVESIALKPLRTTRSF